MSYDTQAVTVIGNLTKDPVLRGDGDSKRATFTVAVNVGDKDRGTDKSLFHDVTAFGRLGENVAKSLRQGKRAIVYGVLHQYQIEAAIDGETKSITKTSIRAYNAGPDLTFAEAELTDNPRRGGGNGGQQSNQQATRSAPSSSGDVF